MTYEEKNKKEFSSLWEKSMRKHQVRRIYLQKPTFREKVYCCNITSHPPFNFADLRFVLLHGDLSHKERGTTAMAYNSKYTRRDSQNITQEKGRQEESSKGNTRKETPHEDKLHLPSYAHV